MDIEQLDAVLSSGNRQLLNSAGKISHEQAMQKAQEEYRKYQQAVLSPVEEAYMEVIKGADKKAKTGVRKK